MEACATVIDVATVAANLGQPDWRIVDCRFNLLQPAAGRTAWLDAHIPGAVYADLDVDLAGPVTPVSGRHPLPDAGTLSNTLSGLGIDGTMTVVVYDDASGAIAARLWWLLRWLGHTRVAVLDGGFAAWLAGRRTVENGPTRVESRPFRGSARHELEITTQEVIERLANDPDFRLVDARDAARFRGEVEPIDRIAGHIPGAMNLPFSVSLEPSGHWRSPDELAAAWANVAPVDDVATWAVMCGSGVTACHLSLSAARAGIREPRLYAGSWSEWIRDSGRPIATGPD